MYYPILRGRQFELIALRELASETATQESIVPIVEPVKESVNNLRLAHNVLETNNQKLYLIVNPSVGEYVGDSEYYLDFLNELNSSVFKPAFLYKNENAAYITEKIQQYELNECMIIGTNAIGSNDEAFIQLISEVAVTDVTIYEPERNRDLKRRISALDKNFIRLDDFFKAEDRNSDYLRIGTHRFSEEHKYYQDDGYTGFSDFTVLPSLFKDGGSTPRAVVIHLSYLNGQDQIWISHFTSITNDSIADVQGKFGEAAHKCVDFCIENDLDNTAISELKDYYERGHYPGLGTVKKISIKNHLLIVANYLQSL